MRYCLTFTRLYLEKLLRQLGHETTLVSAEWQPQYDQLRLFVEGPHPYQNMDGACLYNEANYFGISPTPEWWSPDLKRIEGG